MTAGTWAQTGQVSLATAAVATADFRPGPGIADQNPDKLQNRSAARGGHAAGRAARVSPRMPPASPSRADTPRRSARQRRSDDSRQDTRPLPGPDSREGKRACMAFAAATSGRPDMQIFTLAALHQTPYDRIHAAPAIDRRRPALFHALMTYNALLNSVT